MLSSASIKLLESFRKVLGTDREGQAVMILLCLNVHGINSMNAG